MYELFISVWYIVFESRVSFVIQIGSDVHDDDTENSKKNTAQIQQRTFESFFGVGILSVKRKKRKINPLENFLTNLTNSSNTYNLKMAFSLIPLTAATMDKASKTNPANL